MKKVVSIVLALIMVLSSVAVLAEGFVPAASYDPGERSYFGGNVTLESAPAGGGSITTDVYAGIEGKDYTDEKVYTFNDYTTAITSSMNWDVLSWETNEDSAITDYIITGWPVRRSGGRDRQGLAYRAEPRRMLRRRHQGER